MGKHRKRIGALVILADSFFHTQLWKGIKLFCEEQDWDLLLFNGVPIHSNVRDEEQHNMIHELISSKKLDGLIVATGVLANYIGKEAVGEQLKAFGDLPIISLLVELPGYHSVIIDNKNSMKAVTNHLIVNHGYKEIAYISGPKTNIEAVERTAGFVEAMLENGRNYDESIVYEGDFREGSVAPAIDYFYRIKNRRPDVIIAANDVMALEAYKVLEEMGMRVPEDVAITGFDGTERGQCFYTPLTTIEQPLFEMGYKAAEALCKLFSGVEVEPVIGLKGKIVIGESCGCFESIKSPNICEVEKILKNSNNLDFMDTSLNLLIENCDEIVKTMLDSLEIKSSSRYKPYMLELISSLVRDLKMGTKDQFLKILNRLIQEDKIDSEITIRWQNALFVLRKYIEELPWYQDFCAAIDDIFYNANIHTGHFMVRKEKIKGFKLREELDDAYLLIQAFTRIATLEGMLELVMRTVKKHEFLDIYLCLYENPISHQLLEPFEVPNIIQLIFGYQKCKEVAPVTFQTKEMLPESILNFEDRVDLVFHALFFRTHHFGYIVVDVKTNQTPIFKSMKEQIANFLERKLLFDQLEMTNNQLQVLSWRDVLTGLYNRRGFYEFGEKAYQKARENHNNISIIYGDLDGLKKTNDAFGHYEGDYFIKTIAEILTDSFDQETIIGRVGGDEFIICLIEESFECTGYESMTRILENIDTLNHLSIKKYKLAISLGMAIYNPANPLSFEELIKEADRELYINKKQKMKVIIS